jgi:simple sugar transport system ATP-binding protein
VVGSQSTERLDARDLGRLMLGKDRETAAADWHAAVRKSMGPVFFELKGVCSDGYRRVSRLRGLDLELRGGEIVGIVGIDGNGQRELEELLAGVRPMTAGSVRVEGEAVSPHIESLRRLGVAQLSGDRERAGLVAGMSLVDNWVLKRTHGDAFFFPRGWQDRGRARAATVRAIEQFSIQPADPDALVSTLSGGNAQKLAIARELADEPKVLIAINPTRGLDVGSTDEVHARLAAVRRRGGSVLLISTELDEVQGLADRVFALVEGQLMPVAPGIDRASLGTILLGRGEVGE